MPQPIFLVSLYLYHFGQFIILAAGLKAGTLGTDRTLDSFRFDLQTLHDCQTVAWSTISALQVGGLYALRKSSTAYEELPLRANQINHSRATFQVGLLMAVVGFVPAMRELLDALLFRSAGTLASFTASNQKFGVADTTAVIGQAFLPGLLFMVAGANGNRRIINLVTAVCTIWFLLYAAIGDRSTGILPLIALAWIANISYRRIPWRYLNSGIAFLALVVNPLVALTRNTSGLSDLSSERIQAVYTGSSNPALTFLNETGCSVIPLADTIELVPEERPYGLGLGYVQNLVLSPFSFLLGSGIQIGYGANAYWLIKSRYPSRLTNSAFLGFSSVAEAYIEFGPFAPIVGLLLGYILTRSAYVALRSRDATKLGAQAVFLLSLIHFARGDSGELGRPIIRYIMFPILLMIAIEKFSGKRSTPTAQPALGQK